MAKLCAHREKDLNFVRALYKAGLVDAAVIADRLGQVDARHQQAAGVAVRWLAALPAPSDDVSGDTLAPHSSTAEAGPPWERATTRVDGAAHERRTPPRSQRPPGPTRGR